MYKRKTFQLHQRRGRIKNELRTPDTDLDQLNSGDGGAGGGTGVGGGGGGCTPVPCGPGTFDECVEPDCFDTFTRTVSDGWGTGEINIPWYNNADGSVFSTNGTQGVYENISSIVGWPITVGALESNAASYPLEFTVDFTPIANYSPTSYDVYAGTIYFAIDTATTPQNYIVRAGIQFDLKAQTATLIIQGPSGENDSSVIFTSSSNWESVLLRIRCLFGANSSSAKLWKASDSEPTSYQVSISHGSNSYSIWKVGATNFPGTFYNGPDHAFKYTFNDMFWISGFCGGGGGCIDTFDRTETGTWGTGLLGTWQYINLATYFEENFSVDGDIGIYSLVAADQDAGFVYVKPSLGTGTIELLCRFAVEINWNSSNIEWSLQMDGEPTPFASTDWIYMLLDFVDVQGTFSNHSFSLDFSLQTSEGGFDESLGMFTKSGIVDDAYARWDLWTRLRFDLSGNVYARLWEDGDTEPVTWTMEDVTGLMAGITMTTIGHQLSPESDGVNYTIFETHSLEITEGCVPSGCGDTIGNIYGQGGLYAIVEGDPNAPVTGGVYSNIVLGGCRRIDSTTYELPMSATSVISVSVDGLHINGWSFTPYRTITLPSPISSTSRVTSRFVVGT